MYKLLFSNSANEVFEKKMFKYLCALKVSACTDFCYVLELKLYLPEDMNT